MTQRLSGTEPTWAADPIRRPLQSGSGSRHRDRGSYEQEDGVSDNLKGVEDVLLSLKSPTVAKVQAEGWLSVSTIVDEYRVPQLIPGLKHLGDEDSRLTAARPIWRSVAKRHVLDCSYGTEPPLVFLAAYGRWARTMIPGEV